jgi:hypothetical protein
MRSGKRRLGGESCRVVDAADGEGREERMRVVGNGRDARYTMGTVACKAVGLQVRQCGVCVSTGGGHVVVASALCIARVGALEIQQHATWGSAGAGRRAMAVFQRFPSTAYVRMTRTLDEDGVDKQAGALVAVVEAREQCAVYTGAGVLLAGKAIPICVENRARGGVASLSVVVKYTGVSRMYSPLKPSRNLSVDSRSGGPPNHQHTTVHAMSVVWCLFNSGAHCTSVSIPTGFI